MNHRASCGSCADRRRTLPRAHRAGRGLRCARAEEVAPDPDDDRIDVPQDHSTAVVAKRVPGRSGERLDDRVVPWRRVQRRELPLAAEVAEEGRRITARPRASDRPARPAAAALHADPTPHVLVVAGMAHGACERGQPAREPRPRVIVLAERCRAPPLKQRSRVPPARSRARIFWAARAEKTAPSGSRRSVRRGAWPRYRALWAW